MAINVVAGELECTYAVPVHTPYLYIRRTCTYAVPVHTPYMYIRRTCTCAVHAHTPYMHITKHEISIEVLISDESFEGAI